ncbi:MAG: VTT domain-containing protein [Candidatus Paceibacterota bacterium]
MDATTTVEATSEILKWISEYGYLALLPLFIIEGPVTGIASGVLVSLGALKLLPVFVLYVLGTYISDSILYYLSRDGEIYLRRISLGRKAIERVHRVVDNSSEEWKQKFRDNYFSLMVFARLAPINLVSEFVVLTAGVLKIPTRKFYAPVLISQPIWSALIIAVGYFFGDVVTNPGKILTDTSIIFVVGVCLFFLYRRYVHQYIKEGILGRIFDNGELESEAQDV